MRCANCHSYNLYCAQELPQGSSLKKKSVSGGSFIRVKSVKEELIGRPLAITNFNMRDIWRTVPDSWTITVKQNVRFQVEICSENFQLEQIKNDRLPAFLTLICLIFDKLCLIATVTDPA